MEYYSSNTHTILVLLYYSVVLDYKSKQRLGTDTNNVKYRKAMIFFVKEDQVIGICFRSHLLSLQEAHLQFLP